MISAHMVATAGALVAPGKGILAADESSPTMAKRLASIDLESTEERRRSYREILFTTPGLSDFVSGVILYDETIRQRAADGTPFAEVLERAHIVPGIKVDAGTRPLAGFPGEVITEGLDLLRDRFAEYVELGARFAKWRAVIRIGDSCPSRTCVEANAHALARYAALAQEAGLVPIVEPEVLMDGSHSLDRCAKVTTDVLREVYAQLARQRVELEGTLLKPNMVLPGAEHPDPVHDESIAATTVTVLREAVPAAVPGVVFLSGGQSEREATARLDAINRQPPQPWNSVSPSDAHSRRRSSAPGRATRRTATPPRLPCGIGPLNGAARYGTYLPTMEAIQSAPTTS